MENLENWLSSKEILKSFIPLGIAYQTEKALGIMKKDLVSASSGIQSLAFRGFTRFAGWGTDIGTAYVIINKFLTDYPERFSEKLTSAGVYATFFGLRFMAHTLMKGIQGKYKEKVPETS